MSFVLLQDSCGGTFTNDVFSWTPDYPDGGRVCSIRISCTDGVVSTVQTTLIRTQSTHTSPTFDDLPIHALLR